MGGTTKIDKKITGYSIKKPTTEPAVEATEPKAPVEATPRPEALFGATYKIKNHMMDNALYVTINHTVTGDGVVRPYEVFLNSKCADNFQWVIALTRTLSAVWRKGGDSTFIIEEFKSVFDPKGGYFKKGGKFVPSLVAEIGMVIEDELKRIGVIKTENTPTELLAYIEGKKACAGASGVGFPPSATVCPSCSTKAAVLMDGCTTCLSCGYSKCG
jgi:hypothetical protein